jgi:hypothetical protein
MRMEKCEYELAVKNSRHTHILEIEKREVIELIFFSVRVGGTYR